MKRYLFLTGALIVALSVMLLAACAKPPLSVGHEPNRVPVFVGTGKNVIGREDALRAALNADGKHSLSIKEDGSLTFFRAGNLQEAAPELSEEEAIRTAEQFLSNLGLLPTSGYQTSLQTVVSSVLDSGNGDFSQQYISEYQVAFYHTHNGTVAVSDEEDGILLSFDANGLSSLRYYWRDIAVEAIPDKGAALTREQALQIFAEKWSSIHGDCCEPFADPFLQQTYLQLKGSTRPCWMVAEDSSHGNAVYIDMYTGEVLYPSAP